MDSASGGTAHAERPGLFRSIRPAWNDFNLRELAANIESRLFLAHVRATSLATVQETNCHPFRYGNWLFVHNGEIFEIEKVRRELLMTVAPEYFDKYPRNHRFGGHVPPGVDIRLATGSSCRTRSHGGLY